MNRAAGGRWLVQPNLDYKRWFLSTGRNLLRSLEGSENRISARIFLSLRLTYMSKQPFSFSALQPQSESSLSIAEWLPCVEAHKETVGIRYNLQG